MRRGVLTLLVLVTMGAAPPPAAGADQLLSFDEQAGQFPEGVAVDKRGTVFFTFAPLGQVLAWDRDGGYRTLATLPTGEGPGALGLAVDAPGNVYVGHTTFDPDTGGVYRIARNGSVVRLPGSGAITFPNGLTFDKRGTLYITDSFNGAIWRIPKGGSAELWLDHPLLDGDGSANVGFPIGANGIAYRRGVLYIANTEKGTIVTVPVNPDGSAGTPTQLVRSGALFGADGAAFDVHGWLWVAVIAQSTIVRVAHDGSDIDTFATAADGLDWASSLAFGTSKRERRRLYVVNFSVGELFGLPPNPAAALLAFDAGIQGQPVP